MSQHFSLFFKVLMISVRKLYTSVHLLLEKQHCFLFICSAATETRPYNIFHSSLISRSQSIRGVQRATPTPSATVSLDTLKLPHLGPPGLWSRRLHPRLARLTWRPHGRSWSCSSGIFGSSWPQVIPTKANAPSNIVKTNTITSIISFLLIYICCFMLNHTVIYRIHSGFTAESYCYLKNT